MTQETPSARELMAAIRKYCDEKGLKGRERAEYIREFKRLTVERLGVRL